MKGAGQTLRARLIPPTVNRGPLFPHWAVALSGGDISPCHGAKERRDTSFTAD